MVSDLGNSLFPLKPYWSSKPKKIKLIDFSQWRKPIDIKKINSSQKWRGPSRPDEPDLKKWTDQRHGNRWGGKNEFTTPFLRQRTCFWLTVSSREREGERRLFNANGAGDAERAALPVAAVSAAERAGLCHQRVQPVGHREPPAVPAAAVPAHRRRPPCSRRCFFSRYLIFLPVPQTNHAETCSKRCYRLYRLVATEFHGKRLQFTRKWHEWNSHSAAERFFRRFIVIL